jgi:hypothetical protein
MQCRSLLASWRCVNIIMPARKDTQVADKSLSLSYCSLSMPYQEHRVSLARQHPIRSTSPIIAGRACVPSHFCFAVPRMIGTAALESSSCTQGVIHRCFYIACSMLEAGKDEALVSETFTHQKSVGCCETAMITAHLQFCIPSYRTNSLCVSLPGSRIMRC